MFANASACCAVLLEATTACSFLWPCIACFKCRVCLLRRPLINLRAGPGACVHDDALAARVCAPRVLCRMSVEWDG